MDPVIPSDYLTGRDPLGFRTNEYWPRVEQAACADAIKRNLPAGWGLESMEYIKHLEPVKMVRIRLKTDQDQIVVHEINVRQGKPWGLPVLSLLEAFFSAEYPRE